MTAATVPNAFTRSQFVRVRALPAVNTRRQVHIPAVPAAAVSAPSRSEGAAAVQRAVANHTSAARAGGKQKRHDSVEFRLIFSAAFAFFLFTSVIERALPHKWAAGDGEVRKSVIEQAREAAHISAGYAFMG
jgi:hypothetical protein